MKRVVIVLIAILLITQLGATCNPFVRHKWADGTWTGKSATDDRGAYGTIELTIKNGKITEADYQEIQQDGTPKGADYPHREAVNAMKTYEDELVSAQDVDKVDKVSGATGTWGKFKEAANDALSKAAK